MLIKDKSEITNAETDEIKKIFHDLVKDNQRYDADEIASWLKNEGSWDNKESRIRIVNLSNYIQDKYQQTSSLKIFSDDDCN